MGYGSPKRRFAIMTMIKPFEQPTYTQFHNAALDHILPAVSPATWKLLSVIVRQTRGYHKDWDWLSLTQLEKLSGMSRPTVISACQDALEQSLILRRSRGTSYEYRLNPNYEIDDGKESLPVKNLDQTSKESLPEPVKNLDTQKKEIKSKENKGEPRPPSKKKKGKARDERLDHPAMKAYNDIARLWPPHAWRDRICAVRNIDLWVSVVTSWVGKGWNPRNVQGMLDAYNKGGIEDWKDDTQQVHAYGGSGQFVDYTGKGKEE